MHYLNNCTRFGFLYPPVYMTDNVADFLENKNSISEGSIISDLRNAYFDVTDALILMFNVNVEHFDNFVKIYDKTGEVNAFLRHFSKDSLDEFRSYQKLPEVFLDYNARTGSLRLYGIPRRLRPVGAAFREKLNFGELVSLSREFA